MFGTFAIVATLCFAQPTEAESCPDDNLVRVFDLVKSQKYDEAESELLRAEACVGSTPGTDRERRQLAKIRRHQGIVAAVRAESAPRDSAEYFRRAGTAVRRFHETRALDSTITLGSPDAWMNELFGCAEQLEAVPHDKLKNAKLWPCPSAAAEPPPAVAGIVPPPPPPPIETEGSFDPHWSFWVTGAATVVAAGVAGVMGISTYRCAKRGDSTCNAEGRADVTNVMWGVTGVFGAATLTIGLVELLSDDEVE